jgi:hypothetical protein
MRQPININEYGIYNFFTTNNLKIINTNIHIVADIDPGKGIFTLISIGQLSSTTQVKVHE